MEHFVRIVMEKQEGATKLDESIFAEQEIYETEQGATVYEIALPRQLSEEESDEYANRLANYMFEQGYDDFDIEISMNEAYIKTRKDAVEALGRLRGIGKKIETGKDTFDGNLANMYVSDVYDVYSWMDSKLGISGMNDPKLKQVLDPVMQLRGEAKKLETEPGSGENARFGNQIVNALYPLMVYIQDHMEEPKDEGIEEETYDGDDFYEEYGVMWFNEDDEDLDEAEYQGRKVKLGKPMRGDVKKFKVYVKDPKTKNVKKVNFGDPNMKIKKSNPARRRSFRARHNCDNPGPRTKARYWSCRKW
jgi:hypothetical protein